MVLTPLLTNIVINGVTVQSNSVAYCKEYTYETIYGDEIGICDIKLAKTVISILTLAANQTVDIYRGTTGTTADEHVFSGFIESYSQEGGWLEVRAKDKLQTLMRNEVTHTYLNTDSQAGKFSAIFQDLVTTYGTLTADSTTVQDSGTAQTTSKYVCNHDSVFSKCKELADTMDWQFYYKAATDKVYFEPKGFNNATVSLIVGTGPGANGPDYAGTAVTDAGSGSWNNPSNATGNTPSTFADAVCAPPGIGVGGNTQALYLTNFGFSIDSTQTVQGITAEVECLTSSANNDVRFGKAQLTKDGTTGVGTNKGATANNVFISTIQSFNVFGGTSDTWGTTFTASEVSSSNFGIIINFNETNLSGATVKVYRVRITVQTDRGQQSNVLEVPKWQFDSTEIINDYTVIGAPQIVQEPAQLFSGDGSTTTFTVTYEPETTIVSVGGVSKQGQIEGSSVSADYYVDKKKKQIRFASAPASGSNNVSITIGHLVPSLAHLTSQNSMTSYGTFAKTEFISDIKSAQDAVAQARNYLNRFSQPFKSTTLKLNRVSTSSISVGQNVSVTDNITTVNTVSGMYTINRYRIKWPTQYDEIDIGDKTWRLAEWQGDVSNRIYNLEKNQVANQDYTLQAPLVGKNLRLRRKSVEIKVNNIQDSFILSHTANGVLGTSKLGDRRTTQSDTTYTYF